MRIRAWTCLALAAALASGAANSAFAGPPRGPAFGANQYTTSIDPVGQEIDEDDFVSPLYQGETLAVTVASGPSSLLLPTLRIVDPDGVVVDPAAREKKGGRLVVLRGFPITKSGPWTVRVGAAQGSVGEYSVKFKVTSPKPVRFTKQALGGVGTLTAEHAFEAVEGASLAFTLKSDGDGAPATLRSLVDPAGHEVPRVPDAVVALGNRVSSAGIVLGSGHGGYRLTVGIDDGGARYSLILGVTPPARPAGKSDLSPDEPFLAPRVVPLDGTAGGSVRITGANFPSAKPYAAVYFGDARAGIVDSAPGFMDVVPPPGADDSVVDVTVVNPDGQAASRAGYFHYTPQAVLDVEAISPAEVVLQQGATQTFTVTLNQNAPPLGADVALLATDGVGTLPVSLHVAGGAKTANFLFLAASAPAKGQVTASRATGVSAEVTVAPPAALTSLTPSPSQVAYGATQSFTVMLAGPAPPAGLDVALSATGGIGTVPASVHIPGNATGAAFDLTAASTRAAGTITATSANAVTADVAVVPPSTIDVSGWKIDQANSARTFTIPAGTVLSEGGYVVIGRNATRAQFEAFWGRTLGANVVYFSGADIWPNINGGETYTLKDATNALRDGTSIALAVGNAYRRTPGTAPGQTASWTVSPVSTTANATPGSGQTPAAAAPGVYVSEFADASGAGNYVYEFVELHFDRLP